MIRDSRTETTNSVTVKRWHRDDPEYARVVAVYADGGVIGKNPSDKGGTWAFCHVNAAGERVVESWGWVEAGRPVTNNHTEHIALALGLESLPDGWSGDVFSDSQIALGRIFSGWKCRNLPDNVESRARIAADRLGKVKVTLLQGHPTRKELEANWGSRKNLPVSVHNEWCDKACNEAKTLWANAKGLDGEPEATGETQEAANDAGIQA